MNYLERLLDEQHQLRNHMRRHEETMQHYIKKDEELTEIIDVLSKLERYRGEENE